MITLLVALALLAVWLAYLLPEEGLMDDRVERVMEVLARHRWKSMGVSSVECECGKMCHGDDSMTQFPADEAFRRHLADEIVQVT